MSIQGLAHFTDCQASVNIEAVLAAITCENKASSLAIAALRSPSLILGGTDLGQPSGISVARTFCGPDGPHSTKLHAPLQHVALTISLVNTDLLLRNGHEVFVDGLMLADTACLTDGDGLEMQTRRACDLLHLAIPERLLIAPDGRSLRLAGLVVRDRLIGRIGRLLGEAPASWLRIFADLLSQLAVIRIRQLAQHQPPSRLPSWRLKKVQAFVEANISDPLRLGDLAAASGLSRMHFAAQFRAATGMRPHDYVLLRRVEQAKRLMATGDTILVEVALISGFSRKHISAPSSNG